MNLFLQVVQEHLVGVVLLDRIPIVLLCLELLFKAINLSLSLLHVHKFTSQVLAQLGIHGVDSVEPEVAHLVRVHVLTDSTSLLLKLGHWGTDADVLCHGLSVRIEPLLITHGLGAVCASDRHLVLLGCRSSLYNLLILILSSNELHRRRVCPLAETQELSDIVILVTHSQVLSCVHTLLLLKLQQRTLATM